MVADRSRELTDEDLDAAIEAVGCTIVRTDDPDETATELAERLDAGLVSGLDEFREALDERLELLTERIAAHTALELQADVDAAAPARHVVADVATLRGLVTRIERADALVEASRTHVRGRAATATGLVVHPDAIRAAAGEVREARHAVAAAEAALESGDDTEAVDADEVDHADVTAAAADADFWTQSGLAEWHPEDRARLVRSGVVGVVALVVAVLLLLVEGTPVGFVLPGVAVAWAGVLVVRHRRDLEGTDVASEHLASIMSMTDRAYGGLPFGTGAPASPASDGADRLRAAEDRLRYAEHAWHALVGADADVDDLEAVVRARDPRYGLSAEVVDRMPSVRATAAHARRLRAQWKVAWWALDRPVPPLDDAAAALDALDALDAEGVGEITVEVHASRDGAGSVDLARLDELRAGRSDDELRAAAERTVEPLVVHDDGTMAVEEFLSRTAQLPEDVRVLLVTTVVDGDGGGEGPEEREPR